tara:strand:+ start:1194 stop:1382 length:189 start_codon:yes stop_codon:yes gene_type:complete
MNDHPCKYHDYLTYAERDVSYTLATRQLREVARRSENIKESEEWREILYLIDEVSAKIKELL